jgi:hypothetical protein
MLQEKKTSTEIFEKNFVSAEGWYSQLVFNSNVSTKIVGRGFDDFYRHPVVYHKGVLSRCSLSESLTECINHIVDTSASAGSVHDLPRVVVSGCI